MDQPRPRNFRRLEPGQRSELRIGDIGGAEHVVVWESSEKLFEAPNWTPDGRWLVFNQEGDLYRVAPERGSRPEKIAIEGDFPANNDHVLSPDGSTLYISVSDGHIYAVPFAGGAPRRVSNVHQERFTYYLHGVSPDNATLAYVAVQRDQNDRVLPINTYTIPSRGGPDTRLTDWRWNDDGPEYSPDGAWIYFNSVYGSDTPGHSQVCRMRPDGSEVTRITNDERVNWFPHPSPNGEHILYLSFPPGTEGHPANKEIALRLMHPDGREQRDLAWFNGGQGTTNVNGWAPDSQRFAYVAYPVG
ncbi:MAG: biopolymer transporter Tol [Chloroflexota bacterium]|nr:MAG: biopolymer transporter Tol [Chloroflexota bacterium]